MVLNPSFITAGSGFCEAAAASIPSQQAQFQGATNFIAPMLRKA
jgi:hypothetical protein